MIFDSSIFLTQTVIGIFTVVAAIGSSVGFWAFVQKKNDVKSASAKLLCGLAHQTIISLGSKYIERGWLTIDEYDDFVHYLYNPYAEVGGNGLAERIFNEVKNLPVKRSTPTITEIIKTSDPID